MKFVYNQSINNCRFEIWSGWNFYLFLIFDHCLPTIIMHKNVWAKRRWIYGVCGVRGGVVASSDLRRGLLLLFWSHLNVLYSSPLLLIIMMTYEVLATRWSINKEAILWWKLSTVWIGSIAYMQCSLPLCLDYYIIP